MRTIRPILTLALLFALAPGFRATGAQPSTTAEVKKLVAVLQSNASQKEKADACRELARIGNKDAVAPLAALLPDEKLSHMARYGLETIPDPSVDKALRAALDKVQGKQLVGVIGSIGVRRDAKAVEPLSKFLRDPNPDVAQAAARAMGSIGNPAAAKAIEAALADTAPANQVAFCEGLFRCAEALTAKGSRKQAMAIYDRVRAMPAPHQVRTAALRGAILTRQQAGLPLLLESMRANDYAVFADAVRISQELPGAEVTRAMSGELASLPADRQILLVQTLGRRADDAALPALYTLAGKGEPAVRLAAVRALAQIGSPSSVPVLVGLLDAPDKDIAAAAQESLAALPGKEADVAIMKLLADGTAGRRITAMELIVRRRMTTAIPAMFDAAGSSDAQIRIAAVKKLGELAGPPDLPRLLDLLLRAASPEELEAAEQALSAVSLKAADPAGSVRQVEARLPQASPGQKCALVRVLGAVGGSSALGAVRAAVSDPNADVHAAAIRTLGAWSTADAAPDLLELAKAAATPTDKMICLRGYLRLAGQTELPTDKRLAMCRQAAVLAQKDDEKKLLLAALGDIASVEALALITPYLEEPGTKEEAATAAVDIADKLLKGKNAAKLAPKLTEPLEKVAQATANADLAKRAKALGDQAESKANAK